MEKINAINLTKDYGNNRGIFNLNFSVNKGEVFGFLGPNGAGKTTTLRHFLGFLNADKGKCIINNLDCRKNSAKLKENLGYLPGEIMFFEDMTGVEFFKFMAKMRKLNNLAKMEKLIKYFELDPILKIKKMSKGMKQKVGIVCAFMHDPKILILDEPTSGLDPLMQSKFIDLILQEKKEGKTILMSSHSFEEIERTCDRVGIIKNGRFVAIESIENLKKLQRKIYRIGFKSAKDAEEFKNENFNILNVESQYQNYVEISIGKNINEFINILSTYSIISMDMVSQNLEEIFMTYYGGENSDK